FSMIVCRIESRLSEDVRALATSWKMAISSNCRLRSVVTTSLIIKRSLYIDTRSGGDMAGTPLLTRQKRTSETRAQAHSGAALKIISKVNTFAITSLTH